jgi:hypothetical protein
MSSRCRFAEPTTATIIASETSKHGGASYPSIPLGCRDSSGSRRAESNDAISLCGRIAGWQPKRLRLEDFSPVDGWRRATDGAMPRSSSDYVF